MPENRDGIAVSISIPVCSQGLVVYVLLSINNDFKPEAASLSKAITKIARLSLLVVKL